MELLDNAIVCFHTLSRLRKPISVLLITVLGLLCKTVIGKTCPADFHFLLICVCKMVIGKTCPADFCFLLICVRKSVIGKTCPADFRFSCRFPLLAHLRTQNGNRQDLPCRFPLLAHLQMQNGNRQDLSC